MGLHEPPTTGSYVISNNVHITDNNIIYCIICTDIIDDDTEESL